MIDRERTLIQIAQHLDISPSDFKRAEDRYNTVKKWLSDGAYFSGSTPDVYIQGSFRLGTVVKPYKNDEDGEFDIDQVCELSIPHGTGDPATLKKDIGDRLKANSDYQRMLEDENRRCWTLEYASEEGRPGFHMDILPALPNDRNGVSNQIDITDKDEGSYSWSRSNPKGYYRWFKSKNLFFDDSYISQRNKIFEANRDVYNIINDVPKQLIRTSLQRAVQIMKRHRDVCFVAKDNKPISIIITTIAAHVHSKGDVLGAIQEFVGYIIARHEAFLRDGVLAKDNILDFENSVWFVINPVFLNQDGTDVENFADKWEREPELAVAFFDWVYQLKRDLIAFDKSGISDELNLSIKTFGAGEAYSSKLIKEIEQSHSTDKLLKLIHLCVDGRAEWQRAQSLAEMICNDENHVISGRDRDVALINYYQTLRHQGVRLSEDDISEINRIILDHPSDPAFVMCGHILLGDATREMIAQCVAKHAYDAPLEWPIMRLVDKDLLFSA